jgi:hypothetical protein
VIRGNNQKIAPAGNGAIAGLAMVAMTQEVELGLVLEVALGGNGTNFGKANCMSRWSLTRLK